MPDKSSGEEIILDSRLRRASYHDYAYVTISTRAGKKQELRRLSLEKMSICDKIKIRRRKKGKMTINTKKYENLILYICQGLGGVVDGKKKLAKLLYYADFDRYEFNESMKSVSGDIYKAWKMGPVPERYMEVVGRLIEKGKIEKISRDLGLSHQQELFIAKNGADLSQFDEDDRKIVDRVIKKYGGLTGGQLEALTHQEAPWVATEQSEEIDYGLAFYRGTDFSDVMAVA